MFFLFILIIGLTNVEHLAFIPGLAGVIMAYMMGESTNILWYLLALTLPYCAVFLWFLIRSIKGLVLAFDNAALANPKTWLA